MYLLDKELKSEFQNNWESTGMPGPQQCGPLTQTEKWDGSVLKAGGGSRGRKRRPAVWGPLCLFAYPSIYLQITKLCCYNTLWNCIEIMQMILSLYGSTSQQHTQKSHKHSVETLIQMLNFVFVFFPWLSMCGSYSLRLDNSSQSHLPISCEVTMCRHSIDAMLLNLDVW